jgi:magnesium chelatase family protein
MTGLLMMAAMPGGHNLLMVGPPGAGKSMLVARLSARGYRRVLRVARTLADLDATPTVRRVDVAEALSYRRIAPGR